MNNSSRVIVFGVLLFVLVPSFVLGQKEVELAIRETGYHRLDIIIGEFKGATVLGGERPVFDILKQDLELSGYFRVLDGFELVSDWGDTGNVHEKWATI